MQRFWYVTAAVAVLTAMPGRITAEEPLVKKVARALQDGTRFLKEAQRDQGGRWSWEDSNISALLPGGTSSLAMLALLTAGVPADDPVVRRGMPYIRGLQPSYVYVTGLQTMALAELNDPKDLPIIQRNVDWLINAAVVRGGKLGQGGVLRGWTYQANQERRSDHSNTQYALLGLLAGRQAGARIDKEVWKAINDYYRATQTAAMVGADGKETAGWPYVDGSGARPTLTMTAAGLSGLYISGLELNDAQQQLDEKTGVAAACGKYPDDDALAKGMRWLGKELRFYEPPHTFYNVYGIERVGRLSGQRFLGEHDWYRVGCEILTGVQQKQGMAQRPDGSWRLPGESIDQFSTISTSFALLFLAKGRMPILISKFAYDTVGDAPGGNIGWNRKHHDARHLVEYASREIFKRQPMAWQVFDPRLTDLSKESVFNEELSNLLQSPILYINGHEAPNLTPQQKRLLRRYVDEGGFILAEACCGRPEFAAGFRKLMQDREVFGDESPLMPLAVNHAIWSAHTLVPAKIFQGEDVPEVRRIQSIERGCKTVVVLIPQPLAGYWEEKRFSPRPGEFVAPDDRAKLSYRLAGNIIAYATGFEPPRPRLEKPKILAVNDTLPAAGARFVIDLAQIRHDGGDWQPAKNALRMLAVSVREKYKLDIALTKQEVRMNDNTLFLHKFTYMHGRARFTVDDNELTFMKAHLESGATLLADACCGKREFDESFREFMKKLYPDRGLEVIPEDDPLYSADLNGGEAIRGLRCRLEKADGSAEPGFKDVKPMLEGIRVGGEVKDGKRIGGRWAVIYSRHDIGCALEKIKSSACIGYDPDSALKLASAALLYSLRK